MAGRKRPVIEAKIAGRPSKYSEDVADTICALISEGKSLRSICEREDMPCRLTVFRWLREHQGFCDQYAHARDAAADWHAEAIIEIADTAVDKEDAPAKKLRVDARMWVAAKLKPRVYGTNTRQELTGANGGPIEMKGAGVSGLLSAALKEDGSNPE